jgi:hypothetical protein
LFSLLSNPTGGIFFALKTGVSAGEIADLIDVYDEGAVHFPQGSIVSHESEYGAAPVTRPVSKSYMGFLRGNRSALTIDNTWLFGPAHLQSVGLGFLASPTR